jgi:hypothetical protein
MSGNPSPDITYLYRALYYENRHWVPKDKSLIQEILESEHDSKVAENMRQDKRVELIRRKFFKPNVGKDIRQYVGTCLTYQSYKCPRYAWYCLLHPLELPYAP